MKSTAREVAPRTQDSATGSVPPRCTVDVRDAAKLPDISEETDLADEDFEQLIEAADPDETVGELEEAGA